MFDKNTINNYLERGYGDAELIAYEVIHFICFTSPLDQFNDRFVHVFGELAQKKSQFKMISERARLYVPYIKSIDDVIANKHKAENLMTLTDKIIENTEERNRLLQTFLTLFNTAPLNGQAAAFQIKKTLRFFINSLEDNLLNDETKKNELKDLLIKIRSIMTNLPDLSEQEQRLGELNAAMRSLLKLEYGDDVRTSLKSYLLTGKQETNQTKQKLLRAPYGPVVMHSDAPIQANNRFSIRMWSDQAAGAAGTRYASAGKSMEEVEGSSSDAVATLNLGNIILTAVTDGIGYSDDPKEYDKIKASAVLWAKLLVRFAAPYKTPKTLEHALPDILRQAAAYIRKQQGDDDLRHSTGILVAQFKQANGSTEVVTMSVGDGMAFARKPDGTIIALANGRQYGVQPRSLEDASRFFDLNTDISRHILPQDSVIVVGTDGIVGLFDVEKFESKQLREDGESIDFTLLCPNVQQISGVFSQFEWNNIEELNEALLNKITAKAEEDRIAVQCVARELLQPLLTYLNTLSDPENHFNVEDKLSDEISINIKKISEGKGLSINNFLNWFGDGTQQLPKATLLQGLSAAEYVDNKFDIPGSLSDLLKVLTECNMGDDTAYAIHITGYYEEPTKQIRHTPEAAPHLNLIVSYCAEYFSHSILAGQMDGLHLAATKKLHTFASFFEQSRDLIALCYKEYGALLIEHPAFNDCFIDALRNVVAQDIEKYREQDYALPLNLMALETAARVVTNKIAVANNSEMPSMQSLRATLRAIQTWSNILCYSMLKNSNGSFEKVNPEGKITAEVTQAIFNFDIDPALNQMKTMVNKLQDKGQFTKTLKEFFGKSIGRPQFEKLTAWAAKIIAAQPSLKNEPARSIIQLLNNFNGCLNEASTIQQSFSSAVFAESQKMGISVLDPMAMIFPETVNQMNNNNSSQNIIANVSSSFH